MKEIYEIQLKPRILEITETEQVKLSSISDYFQQIAYEHAYQLKISFQHTFKNNLTWFLRRYFIEINRYPVLDESLTIRTWITKGDKKYSLREYQILDQAGELLCNAISSWLLFDFKKQRLVDYQSRFSFVPIQNYRATKYDFPKLPLPQKVDSKAHFKVRLHDLDLNNHVNNKVYIEWTLESIPKNQLEEYQIKQIEISFKGQAFYEDSILVETELKKANNEEEEIVALHKISNMNTGILFTKLISYWTKRK